MKRRLRSAYVHTQGGAFGVRLPLEEQGQPVMDGASVSRSRCLRVFLFAASLCLAQSGACTPYIGTTYKSFIRQARENPDPNIRYIAYAKLGSPSLYEDKVQKDEAVQDHDRQARGRSRAGGDPRGHHPKPRQPGRSPRTRCHPARRQRHRQRGDPRRGLPGARQGRTARGRDDARPDHDGRQARGLPDRGDRGDRKPEIPRAADLSDPPRRHGPRRPGDPLSVPSVAADDHREGLRHRSRGLETRAASRSSRDGGGHDGQGRREGGRIGERRSRPRPSSARIESIVSSGDGSGGTRHATIDFASANLCLVRCEAPAGVR